MRAKNGSMKEVSMLWGNLYFCGRNKIGKNLSKRERFFLRNFFVLVVYPRTIEREI